jgi:integrase
MPSIRKPKTAGGTFAVRWRTKDGRHCEKGGFATEKQARQHGQEQEALERKNKNTKPSDQKLTLHDFVVGTWGKTVDVRESTKGDYELSLRNHVLPAFGNVPLVEIKPADIKAWFIELKDPQGKGMAESYAEKHCNMLGMILRSAVENDFLDKSPMPKLKRSKQARVRKVVPYTKVMVDRIAATFAARFKIVIWIGFYTGMRPSEILGLTWDQLNFEKEEIKVDRQLSRNPKLIHEPHLKTSASNRTIGFSKNLQSLIVDHVNKFGLGTEGLIVTNRSGNPWRYHDAAEMFREKVRPLGIAKGEGLHQLRHTCVSVLIHQGSNIKEIQAWVGHESIQETMDTYGHIFPDTMIKLSSRLDDFINESDEAPGQGKQSA